MNETNQNIILNNQNSYFSFILHFWNKISHLVPIIEISSIVGFVFLSYVFQKWVILKYDRDYLENEDAQTFKEMIIVLLISFTAPIVTFVFSSVALSISTHLNYDPEIYRISIHLTFVWMAWIFLTKSISDIFVRWIVTCTLIPLFTFTAFGLADPIVNYLDSLSFNLGETRISIFIILKGLLIATCLAWGARFLSQYITSLIENQKKISLEMRDLIGNIFKIILYTTVALITLDLVGIDLKSFAIVGGAIGIGIGLGLQKIAANFISGIIILFEQNVKVGHLVEIPGGAGPGWIRHLGTRAAIIDTEDGKHTLIPNEELLTKSLIDWTAKNKKIRVNLIIKVCFESNLELAKHIILESAINHRLCSKSPPPDCFLQKFTDNGAQFMLRYWVEDLTAGSLEMQNDVLFNIWKCFSKENIQFPILPIQYNPNLN
ncbi:MAG: mechanosensitive ion channel [Parachlamydiaceae bacterium]|nr:mechanosensitive ion channel [Parachlamydiaceae bacterium]